MEEKHQQDYHGHEQRQTSNLHVMVWRNHQIWSSSSSEPAGVGAGRRTAVSRNDGHRRARCGGIMGGAGGSGCTGGGMYGRVPFCSWRGFQQLRLDYIAAGL